MDKYLFHESLAQNEAEWRIEEVKFAAWILLGGRLELWRLIIVKRMQDFLK